MLLLAVFILNALIRFIPTDALGADVDPYLAVAVLQLFVFAVPSLIYMKLRFRDRMPSLRFRLPKSRHIVFTVSAIFVIVLASALINHGMASAFPSVYRASSTAAQAASTAGSFSGGLYAVLTFALVPAVVEEFLFRSIITAEFECAGVGAAVFFSSLTFAMSHFNFMRLPVYFVSGLVLVFVLYVTRSVIASMIVHAATNTVSLFFEELVYRVVNRQGIVMFVFAAAVLLMIAAVIMFGEAEKIYAYYGAQNESADYRPRKKERISVLEVVFHPVFIALAVFYIVMGFVS